jgi:hypothetical protein
LLVTKLLNKDRGTKTGGKTAPPRKKILGLIHFRSKLSKKGF